ncbi:hypothetical protein EXS70_05145 [Candidatus Peribacteria bacterium]|nr:hypothetical protein [Candidatus Peribacteria bacterium]
MKLHPPPSGRNDAHGRHRFTADNGLDLVWTLFFSLVFICLVAAGGTWISARSSATLTQNVRGNLETAAALAAMQFTAEEVEAIHGPEDKGSPSSARSSNAPGASATAFRT